MRKQKSKQKQKNIKKNNNNGVLLLFNTIAVSVFFVSFNFLIENNQGYNWGWNTLLKSNLEFVQKNTKLTTAQKHEIRQKGFYKYLDFINKNTPTNAVILMPPDSIIDAIDKNLNMGNLKTPTTVTYFVYPRKVVYEKDEYHYSINKDKVSYIAIVDYYGYQNIRYTVENKQRFNILPKNK